VTRPPRPSLVYSLVAALSWPVVRFVYRYRAEGREHLPRSGGFVLAAGHVSNLDPWPLGLGLWPRRFLRFMAKSELFWFPLGPILRAAGAFEVHRGRADRDALGTAVALARAGNVVAMFPEGTRRRKGLRKRHEAQPRSGAARIALEAGVPLVPAGIVGTEAIWRLTPMRVRYGPPVPVDDLRGLGPARAAREATRRLMEAIRELEASLA
jgi:1-acyl-sn-glycerol-3-phosphate acyltransferase